MSPITLTTAHLHLRSLTGADAALLQTYLLKNRQHLADWEPARNAAFFSLEQCQHRLIESNKQMCAGNAVFLAIFAKEGEEMIGICNFNNIVRGVFQACHLGYAIARHCEGRSMMFEALQASIPYMFQVQKLHRIMANYVPENARSAALLNRLGFEREGYAKTYLKINGVWRDHVLTALVNSE